LAHLEQVLGNNDLMPIPGPSYEIFLGWKQKKPASFQDQPVLALFGQKLAPKKMCKKTLWRCFRRENNARDFLSAINC
jgi:hypothetical protein